MKTFLRALQIFTLIVFSNTPTSLLGSEIKNTSLPNFSFVTSGDFGCKDEAKRTIDNMVRKNPRFVLALGDLSYEKMRIVGFK
jgi:hypothetical protein